MLKLTLTLMMLLILPQAALAYVGPGSGLSAIGALLALVAGIIVALFGFLWYPLKRMFKKKQSTELDGEEGATLTPSDQLKSTDPSEQDPQK